MAPISIGDFQWSIRTSKKLGHDLIRNKERIIRNGWSAANQNARRYCLEAFEKALVAVDPYRCLLSHMRILRKHLVMDRIKIPLSSLGGVFVLAVGKASAPMMQAALNRLGEHVTQGIIVSPAPRKLAFDSRIETFLAGHPIPNKAGLRASQQVIQAVRNLHEDELLLCLISGGASALLPAPAEGTTLQDKIRITNQLIRSGANIHETNTVRRHLSRLKGGKLVQLCHSSRIISLIVSDVPGNYIPDIGSGLTAGDPTTFQDAIQILRNHNLWNKAPARVKNHLRKGYRGLIPETPKPGSSTFQKVHNIIVAENRTACTAAETALRNRKLRTEILTTSAEPEARDLGKLLSITAAMPKPTPDTTRRSSATIIGGECVVHVTGRGKGGRNQEVALSALAGIEGLDGTLIAAMGTDGIDGNTRAAGAIVDGYSALRAKRRKLDPNRFLKRNDSGRFFSLLGDSLVTGPTGTNVGDIYMMISLR